MRMWNPVSIQSADEGSPMSTSAIDRGSLPDALAGINVPMLKEDAPAWRPTSVVAPSIRPYSGEYAHRSGSPASEMSCAVVASGCVGQKDASLNLRQLAQDVPQILLHSRRDTLHRRLTLLIRSPSTR